MFKITHVITIAEGTNLYVDKWKRNKPQTTSRRADSYLKTATKDVNDSWSA